MSRLYNRRFRLVVSDDAGNGYDLSQLRVTFKIDKKDSHTPANCVFCVYNANVTTRNRFLKGQFTRVFLEAGYGDVLSTIFTGNIKDKRVGTENSVDIFVEVLAGDGDLGLNYAVVNKTLAAGSSPSDHIEACYAPLSEYEISRGQIDDVNDYTLPRGKTMFGSTKFHLRNTELTSGMSFSIQDGAFQGLKKKSYLKETMTVLNKATGLVGAPVLTAEGVNAKMLLNPQIKIGSRVKINQELVTKEALSADSLEGTTQETNTHNIAADGLYRVSVIEHSGDTRGNEWYTTITCIGMDESLPAGEQTYAG